MTKPKKYRTVEVNLLTDSQKELLTQMTKHLDVLNSNPNHGFSKEYVKQLKKLVNPIDEMYKSVAPYVKEAQKVAKMIPEGFQAFQKMAEVISKPVFVNLKYMAAKGWYISPNVIENYFLDDLRDLDEAENIKKLESKILEDADMVISTVIQRCSSTILEREEIFKEIKELYEDERYSSLITLCYAQADGICNDKWGHPFFKRESKKVQPDKTKRKQVLHESLSGLDTAMASVFRIQLDIPENEMTLFSSDSIFNDTEKEENTFNRHKVMHGHSIYFGTRTNAIRAIYLLDYLCYFVDEID